MEKEVRRREIGRIRQGDIPPTKGPKNCATAKSFALGTCGVLALANKYGQNQPLAQSCVFLAG